MTIDYSTDQPDTDPPTRVCGWCYWRRKHDHEADRRVVAEDPGSCPCVCHRAACVCQYTAHERVLNRLCPVHGDVAENARWERARHGAAS